MRLLALPLLTALYLSACAGGVHDDSVTVYKSRGSRQCEGGGVPPDIMRDELTRAGVDVRQSGCGHDGRSRIALCGAGDGRINLFQIGLSGLEQANDLGFEKLEADSHVREQACD